MALDRLGHLEARIHESHELSPQQKEELLRLVSELKEAMAAFSTTHEAHAPSRTRVTDTAAAETARQDTPQHPLRSAMDDVATSVEAFEASHPELVNAVNQISTLLANMGI
jgi:ABC-type transporter Mla subunit MlaD